MQDIDQFLSGLFDPLTFDLCILNTEIKRLEMRTKFNYKDKGNISKILMIIGVILLVLNFSLMTFTGSDMTYAGPLGFFMLRYGYGITIYSKEREKERHQGVAIPGPSNVLK